MAALAQIGSFNNADIEKPDNYSRSDNSNILFVHTDKTLYTNNEIIWFSAYLIKSTIAYSKDHTILSVALVAQSDRKIVLQDSYLMDTGLSFGSLSLPDSIPPGNYMLLASTNVVDQDGRPVAVFNQPLTIKSITQRDFNISLSLLDTVKTDGPVRAQVTVSLNESQSKEKPILQYSIGNEKYKAVVLKETSFVINIPREQLRQAQPVLLTSVKYNRQVQHLSVKLPEVKREGITVNFYPEGGSLVNGLESTIGLEAKTSDGLPIALTGILYRDSQIIEPISTNSYGMGKFRLKPDGNSTYILKVTANDFLKKDTSYSLPAAVEDGLTLQLLSAVTGDSLRLSIYSKAPRSVRVMVHDFRNAYASFQAEAKPSGTKIKIILPIVPRGISAVTILDEQGRPLAERLFFAHHGNGISAGIEPEKKLYGRKEKVNVRLELKDQNSTPVQGLVSIAVIQDNRIEGSKHQDIETYAYLHKILGNLPSDPSGRGFKNKEYLEDMLLVKGWRRYTWQSLINSRKGDTLIATSNEITGRVTYNKKPLKKAITLNIMRDSIFDLITTENDGSFIVSPEQILVTEGRKILFSVNEKNKLGYTIELDNPSVEINQKLSGEFEIQNTGPNAFVQNSSEQQLQGMDRMIALQEVVVRANEYDSFLSGRPGRNACGDYVCSYGILNCSNHHSGTIPVKGKKYQNLIYYGCILEEQSNETIFKVSGVYTAREFYQLKQEDLLEPQFLSTLLWLPGRITNNQGETEFSFTTGDITGKFRIVVQGVSATDMIFGETIFTVK